MLFKKTSLYTNYLRILSANWFTLSLPKCSPGRIFRQWADTGESKILLHTMDACPPLEGCSGLLPLYLACILKQLSTLFDKSDSFIFCCHFHKICQCSFIQSDAMAFSTFYICHSNTFIVFGHFLKIFPCVPVCVNGF